jgi:RsiW-degrading membrane proteinase PrsW (M82 family)
MAATLLLGRDPACDVNIADASVSRRHAELVLLDENRIFVRDLGAANGTSVTRNGTRTPHQQGVVQPGDTISFGDIVVSFEELRDMIRETPAFKASAGREPERKEPPKDRNEGGFRLLDFIPVLGSGGLLSNRKVLWPGLIFAAFVARLLWLSGSTRSDPSAAASFLMELSGALVVVAFIFVYRLCGKRKPWAMILLVMALEMGFMAVHSVIGAPFCQATGALDIIRRESAALDAEAPKPPSQSPEGPRAPGGGQPKQFLSAPGADEEEDAGPPPEMPGFLALFWAYFTCAGLLEELEKMAPVFVIMAAAAYSVRPDKHRWGVFEPLDAIVYACAAASIFILVETFGADSRYVGGPITLAQKAAALGKIPAPVAANFILGLLPRSLIRTLDALTGHMAYSGYFAYFVGLGILRPQHRERLWLGGWVAAAVLHGFYDATTSNPVFTTISTFVAFFFLIAAILRARKTSPTRADNFATSDVSAMT